MRTCATILVGLTFVCFPARADDWCLHPEVKDAEFTFGDTHIVLHYDSTRNQSFPGYSLGIYLKGKLVGKHDHVGFEQVFASPDNMFFLGVSNSGLVEPAYFLFDRSGRIWKKQKHDSKNIQYSSASAALIRTWYDSKAPSPRFTVVDKDLKSVRINASNGARLALPIGDDFEIETFLLERLLEYHAKPKENCYVSFGRESNAPKKGTVYCDPPKSFLKRFEDRPYAVKPVSACPKPGGTEPWPNRNPQTGAPDGRYTVQIVKWLDIKNTAKVKIELFRSGLWARGEELVLVREDGKWRIKEYGDVWAS